METLPLLKIVRYRCACGNTIGLIDHSLRSCQECHREIPAFAYQEGEVELIARHLQDEAPQPESGSLMHSRLRHYKIHEQRSQGATGSVHRAVDLSMQRDVAIKILPELTGERGVLLTQRLLEEARIQGRVLNAHVEQVYFVETENTPHFIASEYVPGHSLKHILESGPVSLPRILDIAVQIVRGLQSAAKLKLLHRDLQPAHILIRNDGCVKIADFGQCRSNDVLSNQPIDHQRSVSYLAPEVCCGNEATIQSDMYSLGVILFEMTFGRLPYADQSEHLHIKLISHQESRLDLPEFWPESLPIGWKHCLERLLCKNAAGRYESYEVLLKELENLAPVISRPASRFDRGLAWLIDLSCVYLLMNCLADSLAIVSAYFLRMTPAQVQLMAGLIAVGVGGLWQATFATTPGKKLLDLRLVNENGYPPKPLVAFLRGVIQFVPVVLLSYFLAGTSHTVLEVCLLILGCFTICEIVESYLRTDALAPHDLLTQTRVLQVGQRSEFDVNAQGIEETMVSENEDMIEDFNSRELVANSFAVNATEHLVPGMRR